MLFYVLLPKEKQQRCVYYICSLISFCLFFVVVFLKYFLLVKCFNCTVTFKFIVRRKVTTEALSGDTTSNNEPGRTGTNQVKPGRTALISPSRFRLNRWGMLCSCTQRLLLALLGWRGAPQFVIRPQGPDWLRLRGDVTRETLAARGAVPRIPQDGASAGAARSRDRRRQGKAAQEVHSVVQFEHVTQIQMWVCV